MSNEVIKVLDAFSQKFGLVIDWTSANALPYLQQLYSKYITYEIATSVVWMLIGIGLLPVGKYVIEKAEYCWGKYKEDRYSDYDIATTWFGILAGSIIIVGIVVVLDQTFDIITCITFPEKVIIEELQSVYSSLK